MRKHDIIIFVETLAPSSTGLARRRLELKGYRHLAATRASVSGGRRSGGVSVFIRNNLRTKIEELTCSRDPLGCESLWFRIHDALPGGGNLLVGACYCAPYTSSIYKRADGSGTSLSELPNLVFGGLSGQLDLLRSENDEALLVGDFNAHVGCLDERAASLTSDTSLPPPVGERLSSDESAVDAFGRHLVDMCRTHELAIINGRAVGDTPAACTCFNTRTSRSCIDLYIASEKVFPYVTGLHVLTSESWGQSNVLSDHLPVVLNLNLDWGPTVGRCIPRAGSLGRPCKLPLFDIKQRNSYGDLFTDPLGDICSKVKDINECLQQGLSSDSGIDGIKEVLGSCLRRAFGPSTCSKRGPDGNAPWWTDQCARAWESMMDFRRRALDPLTGSLPAEALGTWKALHKAFKTTKREALRQADLAALHKRLEDGRSNPRGLWTWLKGTDSTPCAIEDLGRWTTHFSSVLNGAGAEAPGMRPLAHQLINRIVAVDAHMLEGGRDAAWVTGLEDESWVGAMRVHERKLGAVWLNGDFTEHEVVLAIRAMRNNKSAGLEGIQAECYKYAIKEEQGERPTYVLAPLLHSLFNRVFGGDFPRAFTCTTLSPVFKKGDTSVCDNYRGIAVGGALSKLYANLKARRITKHVEAEGLRAESQAGCRNGFGTEDHLFTLRHLITKHTGANMKPLIILQIDFSKAFDSVDHETLWRVLESYGIHGRMLDALKASYEDVRMRVKVNGRLGPEFTVGRGVKQGCPLSVTLFGLYIEMLSHYISAHDTDCRLRSPEKWLQLEAQCATLGTKIVSDLLFVDDASLLATGLGRVQCLLSLLEEFCDATGMKCNSAKCEVLVFGGSACERKAVEGFDFLLGGQRLKVVPKGQTTRYLGLHYGPGRDFNRCTQELLVSGRRATHMVHALCSNNKIGVPSARMALYNTLVVPVLSYGAQVWGPDFINVTFEAAMTNPMVEEQRAFMRSAAGARRPSMICLYRELSQRPLQHHWANLVLRYWNRLTKRPGSLCHRAFVSDLELAVAGNHECWAGRVLSFLKELGASPPTDCTGASLVAHYAQLKLPVGSILKEFAHRLDARWFDVQLMASDPRAFPSECGGVKTCRYLNWMGLSHEPGTHPLWLKHANTVMRLDHHQSLMRFRLGAWGVEVNIPCGRPRAERTCKVCGDPSAIEDELHVFLECPCYERLRDEYRQALGFGHLSMANIMTESPPTVLAEFLFRLWGTRLEVLRRLARKRGTVVDDEPPE